MPAIGNIAINDGASTPVAHTFGPDNTSGALASGALAELSNASASILAGRETLSVKVKKPQTSTAAWNIQMDLVLPTVATVDGSDQVVRSSKASIVINLSQASTAAERKNMRVLLANLLQNALITSVIETPAPLY